ncbi:MAG TPA: SigE family RNA polymerase sigma factor [Actinomycetes bacterium]|nr:SigE family RNA polymerase sigma factor [Actinomycetes bacterium]
MTSSWEMAADDREIVPELDVVVSLPGVESFEGFYAREYRLLVAFAHALTGSRAHAEDVAQEAMLAAYRRWDEVGRLDAPHAWVRRVCANLAVSFVRRRLVEARGLLRLRRRRTEVAALDNDDATFWAEVRRLPKRQAQCIVLSYVYGCSVAEIAQVLECADGTVKTHLARGRSTLAARLGFHGDEGDQS